MRFRQISGVIIFFLSALIAGLNLLALKYFLYWQIWWFDVPMHFLGGLIIGAIALWIVAYEVPVGVRPRVNRLAVAILSTLIVGIMWEIFEYLSGITKGDVGYWQDSVHDVFVDIAGGLAAYLALKDHGK